MTEQVDHPQHYNKHPSGVECIDIVEHMNFNLGSAVKYIWRADLKGNSVQDLEKGIWYLRREIERREALRRAGIEAAIEAAYADKDVSKEPLA